MGVNVKYDFSEYRDFFAKMRAAKSGFRKELEQWLEAIGVEFLNEVREQIISRKVMFTTHMLHTFYKGEENNVWEADFGALRLEVGTNLEYALWVNNGHRTLGDDLKGALRYKEDTKNGKHKKGDLKLFGGVPARFVPGYWKGDKFEYDKTAKSGMVLKFKWVEGKHYFDAAIRAFAPRFEKEFEKKLEEWLTQYFEI